MEAMKASGAPDSRAAAALFAQLSPEGQRAVLDSMRRKLAQKETAPAEMRPGA